MSLSGKDGKDPSPLKDILIKSGYPPNQVSMLSKAGHHFDFTDLTWKEIAMALICINDANLVTKPLGIQEFLKENILFLETTFREVMADEANLIKKKRIINEVLTEQNAMGQLLQPVKRGIFLSNTILVQSDLIGLMNELGYSISKEGICHGFTHMWVMAVLSGDEEKFQKRIKLISQDNFLTKAELLKNKIAHLEKEISAKKIPLRQKIISIRNNIEALLKKIELLDVEKDNAEIKKLNEDIKQQHLNLNIEISMREKKESEIDNQYFSTDEKSILDVFAFFDGIVLYQTPEKYTSIFGQALSQSDVVRISTVTASKLIEEEKGIVQVFSKSTILTKKEFQEYCDDLFKLDYQTIHSPHDLKLDELTNNKIAITISNMGHTNSWCYCPIKNKYLLMDTNFLQQREVDPLDFPRYINLMFDGEPIAINVDIYKTGNSNMEFIKNKLLKFQAKHHDNLITKKTAQMKTIGGSHEGETLALISACSGHESDIRELGRLGADMNAARKIDLVTPAYVAAQNGFAKIIQVLGEYKVNFNQATSNGNVPAHPAAIRGHSNVIRALAEFKADLNYCDPHGFAAIHFAAFHNNLGGYKNTC